MYDAIIVGGSYAGMSAAIMLARARRSIVVIDAGKRRNRFAVHSHGFIGRDGADPAAIIREARQQLLSYPTVTWREGEVVEISGRLDAFTLDVAGARIEARRLLLAIGLEDELPAIPGLAERWGRSVFHCPYCHGYEVEGPIGVLGVSPLSVHQAMMLPDWGPTTYFLNGLPMPSADELAMLRKRGTTLESQPVAGISGHADVILADGRTMAMGGLFTATRVKPSTPVAGQLGCAFDESPAGVVIRVDAMKQTTVPGVFACGDAARTFGSVAIAVGDGAQAGASVHRSLMFG